MAAEHDLHCHSDHHEVTQHKHFTTTVISERIKQRFIIFDEGELQQFKPLEEIQLQYFIATVISQTKGTKSISAPCF